jgi:hypothetical protein
MPDIVHFFDNGLGYLVLLSELVAFGPLLGREGGASQGMNTSLQEERRSYLPLHRFLIFYH